MISTRIFRWMVAMYPEGVRRTFGDEMIAVFQERSSDPSRSALARLLPELRTFPGELLRAWLEAPGSRGPLPRPLLWATVVVLMLVAGWRATHLVANLGLSALTSLTLLAATLMCSGVILGLVLRARSRMVSLALVTIASGALVLGVGLLPLLDDAITRSRAGRASSLSIPGVRVQSFASNSPEGVARYVADHRDALTPRVRVDIRQDGPTTVARIVHAGGVDWLYLAFALCLLGGGFHWGQRKRSNEVMP